MKIKAYNRLLDQFKNSNFVKETISFIKKQDIVRIKHLSGSSASLFAVAISELENCPVLVIGAERMKVEDYLHDARLFINEDRISNLLEPKSSSKKLGYKDDDHIGWLVEGLASMMEDEKFFAVATFNLFSHLLPDREQIEKNKTFLKVGEKLNFTNYVSKLLVSGFTRKDYVEDEGDIAVRGGILDIYPVGYPNPLRIEFWGDEIDSIREFDLYSQRSLNDHKEIAFICKIFHDGNSEYTKELAEYLPSNTIIIYHDIDAILNEEPAFLPLSNFKSIIVNSLGEADLNISIDRQPSFKASISAFAKEIDVLQSYKSNIYITAEGRVQTERLNSLLNSSLGLHENDTHFLDRVNWANETLASGFVFPDKSIAVFTEHQIFERLRLQDKKKARKSLGMTLKDIYDLKIGDFVVHDDKGIARFEGFSVVKIGGSDQDCIRLAFSGDDILYVNMNYIHKIQKYAAASGTPPKLSKLGSTEWGRRKARTKKRIKDIARDLIKLYAERKMQPGYAFDQDNNWQKEFEASFIYEDTPDQASATEDFKRDMESETPMDRLICGDVGFGKTEVAIRAAFKAVQSGKQVAVLTPTTVLAQQHYMSFRDRLARYPLRVDVLSRFKSKSQQTQTLIDLQLGKIDIIIGTHRLLSKDVKFKDLGLLVVDEEQRFGVSAKEKLRQMRVTIDTLTLTATPIPRTLNFSLMGARDLSVIETPPRNRLPVETEIVEWDEEFIANTINKEVNRKGQVFFVSDKVEDLEKIMRELKMMLPHINFVMAHGQMTPNLLEKAMQNFISGKADVLVATKIVESGLDIPNANTILINRANNFGLAELYQLRGRVGRSNRQAYCYLMVPKHTKLTPTALKRLQAIEEFTDLGSGFKLALRDLEIRGAGNLLGAEQSGVIHDMGFELYQKILDEAVMELKSGEFADLFQDSKPEVSKSFINEDIAIELPSDALLPTSYVKNESDRFAYYKRLYTLRTNGELQSLTEELEDKYGKLPQAGKDLVFAVKLRISALYSGFERISLKKDKMTCEFPPSTKQEFYDTAFPVIAEYIQDNPNSKLIQQHNKLIWEVNIDNRDEAVTHLYKIRKSLESLDLF